jgi:membrane protease YdiL (CAAX protease family)
VTFAASLVKRAREVALAVAWILLYAAAGTLLAWALLKLNPVPRTSLWYQPVGAAALALGFTAATWLVGVRLARRPWSDWGWRAPRRAALTWLGGTGIGLLMAAGAVGLALATNDAGVSLTGDGGRYLEVALPLALLLAAAALFEELIFRGFPLRRLADAIGPRVAVTFAAVGFAVAHGANPNASPLGLVNIALAAVLLSFAFFSRGGMVAAWALHFGWNAGLALAFDAPVSGQRLLVPAVEYTPGRHGWVDGGAFGPEGGIVASVVLVAGIAVLLGRRVTRPAQWLA